MYRQEIHDQPQQGAATSFENKLQPPPAYSYPAGQAAASPGLLGGVVYQQPSAPNVAQGYAQVQPVVFVQQMQEPPSDYLGCSIFTMICCCWCIGLAALLESIKCRDAIARGDRVAAVGHSQSAKRLIIVSVVCGIVLYVVCGILSVVLTLKYVKRF